MSDLFSAAAAPGARPDEKVPPRPTMTKGGAFIHRCWCGEWGAFGFGVSLRRSEPGLWYCRQHLPRKK